MAAFGYDHAWIGPRSGVRQNFVSIGQAVDRPAPWFDAAKEAWTNPPATQTLRVAVREIVSQGPVEHAPPDWYLNFSAVDELASLLDYIADAKSGEHWWTNNNETPAWGAGSRVPERAMIVVTLLDGALSITNKAASGRTDMEDTASLTVEQFEAARDALPLLGLTRLTVAQLKAHVKTLGLPTSGTRPTLFSRILTHLE